MVITLSSVIKFNKLGEPVIRKIVKRITDETNEQLKDKGITLELSPEATDHFVTEGYEPTMGARPLKRVFENKIKKPLSKKILFEELSNSSLVIDYVDDEYKIN